MERRPSRTSVRLVSEPVKNWKILIRIIKITKTCSARGTTRRSPMQWATTTATSQYRKRTSATQ